MTLTAASFFPHFVATLLSLLCCFASPCHARTDPFLSLPSHRTVSEVPIAPLVLSYHNGPLLSSSSGINIYLIWYGRFEASQRATIGDFFSSLQAQNDGQETAKPTVSSWWKTIASYKDAANSAVASTVFLKGELLDASYAMGKILKATDIETLVADAVSSKSLPQDPRAVYLVLTAEDVAIERFCMSSCASHAYTFASPATNDKMLPFAWVGNSATQCAGQCAWPFAIPEYGPKMEALVPPNGDVGVDGMIINIATILAGAATNPFSTGYFQGDAAAPLEAATACAGAYGPGAYPGYPGRLLQSKETGGSFNAYGVNGRMFLLPAVWDPASLSCKTLS